MSQVKLIDPVESLQGKMSRKGETIFRCKHYRDANGKIIAQGAQEAYVIAKPRDREKNPPVGAEKRQIDLFAEASRRTTIEIAPDSPRRAYWQQRFEEQQKTAQKPYAILRNFVIAELTRQNTPD